MAKCRMAFALTATFLCFCVLGASCSRRTRFGVAKDTNTYPQDTPQKTIASAIAAMEARDGRYFVAHLLDLNDCPDPVDQRMFVRLSSEFAAESHEETVAVLKKALNDGDFSVVGDSAKATLPNGDEIEFRRERGCWLVRN